MKVAVYNKNGESLGKEIELPDNIFGLELSSKHEHVVYLAVKQYLAHQRQGTHKSKQRAEITGSTHKLYRQKGTGNARKGSVKSPLLRGGGRVFGPQPRNYNIRLNKKVKQLARKAALSAKAQAGDIIVVEDFVLDAPKTKDYLAFVNALETANTKHLLVLDTPDAPSKPKAPRKPGVPRGRKKRAAYAASMEAYREAYSQYKEDKKAYDTAYASYRDEISKNYGNIALSGRNVPKANITTAKNVNVYEIMNSQKLILSEGSIERLKAMLG